MNQGDDLTDAIQERVRQALAENAALKFLPAAPSPFSDADTTESHSTSLL